MNFTGFADEAGRDLATQIKVTKELKWQYISLRSIGGVNAHDLSDEDFSQAAEMIDESGLKVVELGSLIGTWAKPISSDFNLTLAEIDRAIPRMKRLGTQLVRVMSYAQEPWGKEQYEQERFRRLREITARFSAEGLTVAHENCMNWGGFSAEHSLRLIDEVPDLKLIYDTGNPVFQLDRSKPQADGSFLWQDAWDFYEAVKPHVCHVHIKDCFNPVEEGVEPQYVQPGEGQGYVKKIMQDLQDSNYQGYVAIEPHVATVFHSANPLDADWDQCYSSYLEYGQRLEALLI